MSSRKITQNLSSGLLRIGIAICIFCVSIFLFIAWLLEYKDTATGSITITTKAVPLELYAKETGQLKLLKKDNALVSKGDFIGYIENTTKLEHGLHLLEKLTELSTESSIQQFTSFLKTLDKKELGDISPAVVNFSNQIKEYHLFIKTDRHQEITVKKEEQINLHKNYIQLINQKINLHKKNIAIAKDQLLVDQQLFEENVISKRDLDNAKRALNKEVIEGRLIDFQSTISNSEITIAELEENILETNNAYEKEKLLLQKKIVNQFQLLENEGKKWKEKYLLEANVDGKLIYANYLADYSFVKKDSRIMTITPVNDLEYLGLLKLPKDGISKVRPGQPVQIRVDNYPFSEFGILEGRVVAIADIPNNNKYSVQVSFPNNLLSTYKIDFEFQQLMTGQADVITNKLSLWQRIYNQFKSVRYNYR